MLRIRRHRKYATPLSPHSNVITRRRKRQVSRWDHTNHPLSPTIYIPGLSLQIPAKGPSRAACLLSACSTPLTGFPCGHYGFKGTIYLIPPVSHIYPSPRTATFRVGTRQLPACKRDIDTFSVSTDVNSYSSHTPNIPQTNTDYTLLSLATPLQLQRGNTSHPLQTSEHPFFGQPPTLDSFPTTSASLADWQQSTSTPKQPGSSFAVPRTYRIGSLRFLCSHEYFIRPATTGCDDKPSPSAYLKLLTP